MGKKTNIAWTDHTFNPWRGCEKVSPGCANCYAEHWSRRNPKVLGVWGPAGTRLIAAESYWQQPLRWNRQAEREGRRRRVFCASMADVFEDRPELVAPRVRLFHLIHETPNLDWQLLTKRPENIRRFCGGNGIPRSWAENTQPNVWAMTSVEDQETADRRIPELLKVPARVRGLSVEPLLGPVDLRLGQKDDGQRWERHHFIHWVILGGESGPHARPCRVEWVRDLVRQCRATGVACFVKQLGACVTSRLPNGECWPGGNGLPPGHLTFSGDGFGNYHVRGLSDPKGGDPAEWPEDLRVREMPEGDCR